MALLPQLSAIATADARRPGLTRVWPRAHSASAALTYAFLAVALVVALANFVVLLADYRNLFVHPDYHQAILKESLRSGLAIGPQDVVNSLQLRAEGESRPRFLAYFIQAIDQKLRLALYEWLPVHPTLAPVAWFLQGIVAPYCLYRLLVNVTEDRAAALAGLAVYLSAIGFLCGFTMGFLQGKTLSNAAFIVAMYFASLAARTLAPDKLLIDAKGPSKYLLLVALYVGLWVDELPVATFFILPMFYWPMFLPPRPWASRLGATLKNAAFFAIPAVAFLGVVVLVVPRLTEYFFGFTFDYLGNTLVLRQNAMGATSITQGRLATFTPAVVLENVTTLFGLSLSPWFLSAITPSAFVDLPGGQENTPAKIVTLIAFLGAAVVLAIRASGLFGHYLRGYLVALALFFVFLSLLMIRHIPIVTGYYYGALFAALFALLVGMMVRGTGEVLPVARPLAALAVLGIVCVQVVNFGPVNAGWIATHNEQLTRKVAQAKINLTAPRDLSSDEVREIWAAWKRGQIDNYTKRYGISTAAAYEWYELKEIDRNHQPRSGSRRD